VVYSVIYYAVEAITRAVLGLVFWIKERLERRPVVRAKEVERPAIPPGYSGFVKIYGEDGEPIYRWRGRTRLSVDLPPVVDIPAIDLTKEKKNVRLHFFWEEAASEKWFKDIEYMAERIERELEREKKRREGR